MPSRVSKGRQGCLGARGYVHRRREPPSGFHATHVPMERSDRAADPSVLADQEGRKIFLGGLSYDCTEDDLKADFGKYGDLEDVQLPMGGMGKHKGFGFLTFRSKDDAEYAVKQHNQREYLGRPISAKIVVPRDQRGQSDWTCPACGANVFGSKSSCFKCGEPKPRGGGGDRYDRGRDRDRYDDRRRDDRYDDRRRDSRDYDRRDRSRSPPRRRSPSRSPRRGSPPRRRRSPSDSRDRRRSDSRDRRRSDSRDRRRSDSRDRRR